ncbi:hypothetical protein MTO96_045023 [Rhipicephalus appendiculatus]
MRFSKSSSRDETAFKYFMQTMDCRGWRANGLPDSVLHSDQTLLPREASGSLRRHRDTVRSTRVSQRVLHVQPKGLHLRGSYSGGHLPGGASPPRLPAGPSSGFAQYPPPGGAGFPRLPYGARSDVTMPHGTPFGLTTPGAGAGFQPQSGSPLQGRYEPQPPALGLGSRQTQWAAYEQGRRSPQGGGRPQAPFSQNSSRMPGPYETVVGAPPSGGIELGSGRSSPKPAWQNPNPCRNQTSSGRSSPLPMWQNSNQSASSMSIPTLPNATRRPRGRQRCKTYGHHSRHAATWLSSNRTHQTRFFVSECRSKGESLASL